MIKIAERQKCEFIQNDQVLSFTEITQNYDRKSIKKMIRGFFSNFWCQFGLLVIISIYYVLIFFRVSYCHDLSILSLHISFVIIMT